MAEGGDELQRLRDQHASDEDKIARLEAEADIRTAALGEMREALAAAESELGDLRAVRDALTPPQLPACVGLDLDATFLPAAQRVSGDFYLATRGPSDDHTLVVVGDVAGKGIDAAREAAFVRTAFVTTAPFSDDPCRLLEWANVALLERAAYAERFVTAAVVTFDARDRSVRWALAGHPPPLRLDTGEELTGARHGLPLGVGEDVGCREGFLRLAPGEGLLLYTDGLVEARLDGEMLGVERAGAVVRELASAPTQELLTSLRAEVERFGPALSDDLCLVALRAR